MSDKPEPTVEKQQSPHTMALYDAFQRPADINPDTPWEQLTPDERQRVMDAYRFSGFRPGTYQGITGITGMV